MIQPIARLQCDIRGCNAHVDLEVELWHRNPMDAVLQTWFSGSRLLRGWLVEVDEQNYVGQAICPLHVKEIVRATASLQPPAPAEVVP